MVEVKKTICMADIGIADVLASAVDIGMDAEDDEDISIVLEQDFKEAESNTRHGCVRSSGCQFVLFKKDVLLV